MDKETAGAIFSVMAQNKMPDKIDSIFKQIGPSNVSQELQDVCTSLISSYTNVRSYKYIVWSGIKYDGGINLQFVSDGLKDDKDVVTAAVATQCGSNWTWDGNYISPLTYASARLKDNKDVVLAAIEHEYKYTSVLKCAGDKIKNDATFQIDLVSFDMVIYESLINDLKIAPASDKVKAYYKNTKDALNSLGITLYTRISDIKEIIRNRYSVSNQTEKNKLISLLGSEYFKGVSTDTRPVAVMTTPLYDYNGAFKDLRDDSHPLTNGYKLIYYEVSTDQQFANSVKEATIDNHQQAQVLFIGGHGNPKCIEFGSVYKDEDYLDMTDSDIMNQLKGAIADKGHVIEYSCSNGVFPNGNTPAIDNIAEFLHSYWPNAYVHAAMDVFGGINIKYDKNNFFSSVSFAGTNELTISPDPLELLA